MLKLVTNEHNLNEPRVFALMSAVIGLMDDFELSERSYAQLPCWDFTNQDNGLSIRVIYDPTGAFGHRQGIHQTIDAEVDAYKIIDQMEHAESNGFDTIWLHD